MINIRSYFGLLYSHFVKHPYAPFLAQVVMTRRCNLACGYCNEYDKNSDPVHTERLQKTIDKLTELKIRALSFTGGEPVLHPDFIDVTEYACRKIPKVSLVTNGFLLTEKLIRELNHTGISRMQISVDGVFPNNVTQKVLRNTEEKLRLLSKHASFKVHINTVLGSIPFEETLAVLSFAKKLGFETTVQWLHDERGHVLNRFGIKKKEIMMISKECDIPVYHSREIMKVGLKSDKPWKCRAGSRYLYIDEFSVAHFCSQTISLWSLPIDEINNEILKRNFYLRKNCSPGCTLGCVRDSSKYDFFRRQ